MPNPKDSNAAASGERPTIELYLHALNQEFPAGKGHASFVKRRAELLPGLDGRLREVGHVEAQVFRIASDWPAQWVENSWVQNWEKLGAGRPEVEGDPMARMHFREEEFGGVVFDPVADKVYKLNRPGYQLFLEMKEAKLAKGAAPFRSTRFQEDDVRMFTAFLTGAGSWRG